MTEPSASMSANFNLKAVFTLIDRITAPMKKIDATTKAVEKTFDGVTRAAKNTSLSFQYVEQAAAKVTPTVTTMSARIGVASAVLDKYGLSANRVAKTNGLLHHSMGLIATALGGLGAMKLMRDFIHINATLEGYRSSLETTTGSPAGAEKAMKWISNFERKSPYSYEQVADLYTQLQAYGLNPEGGSLMAVANASGAMHKQLWQGGLAMVDAVNGMYRELKLFGIHAKEDKDKVRLSWKDPKTGQWHAGVAQKGSDRIAALVTTAFNQIGAGGMGRMARTWDGLMSNLESAWWRFNKMVADSGTWKAIKADLSSLSDWLANPNNDKVLQKWADKIGSAATKIYFAIKKLLTSIDWGKLLDNIGKFAEWMGTLIDKVGGFKTIFDGLIASWIFFKTIGISVTVVRIATAIIEATTAAEGIIPVIIAAGAAFLGLDVAMGPITLIILAVAALAAGAYLVISNWDKCKGWFMGFLDFMNTSPFVPSWIQGLSQSATEIATHWDKVTDAFNRFSKAATDAWNTFPKPLRDFLSATARLDPYGAVTGAANAGQSSGNWVRDQWQKAWPSPGANPAQPQVRGKLDIHVSHDGKPTVKKVESNTDLFEFNVLNGFQAF